MFMMWHWQNIGRYNQESSNNFKVLLYMQSIWEGVFGVVSKNRQASPAAGDMKGIKL